MFVNMYAYVCINRILDSNLYVCIIDAITILVHLLR